MTDIPLVQFLWWLVKKFGPFVLIAGLMLTVCATSHFLRDDIDLDERRAANLRELTAKRVELARATGGADQRAIDMRKETLVLQNRIRLAKQDLDALRENHTFWQRWFGDPAKYKADAAEIERLVRLGVEANRQAEDLKRKLAQTKWERDGVEIELERLNAEIARAEAAPGPLLHYYGLAWLQGKYFVIGGGVLYVLGVLATDLKRKLRTEPR